METQPVGQFLVWDSQFFGCRIGRLNSSVLTAEAMPDIRAWCRCEALDCLYFLASAEDRATVRLAEDAGFRLVDVRVTLAGSWPTRQPVPARSEVIIRLSQKSDVPALRELARANHTDSRFYYDSHFAPAKCDELYALWLEKNCQGAADFVLVADLGGTVAGYLTGNIDAQRRGHIGLVGVAPTAQGRGIGTQLLQAGMAQFEAAQTNGVAVVTQGRNLKAQRLYQRNGFVTQALELWYHWWATGTL